ncbi:MAG TPA: AraC family transcriptional regulator [Polyangiaceae bacterium]
MSKKQTTAALQRASTLAALLPDPHGKYYVGRTWLSFFAEHGHFSGTIVWGEPTAEDVKEWTAAADLRLSDACQPHATIFDASKVERLSPSTFGALARYATRNLEGLGARITKLAIVHRGGFAGAVAAGFTKLVPVPFPTENFRDPLKALSWLGCADDAPLLEEVGRARTEARLVAPILRDLAMFLHHHPTATPAEAARALALSTRSLQRRLSEQGTTFRHELDQARVRLAQKLLEDSDATVTEVALQVGLTSPQHLSTLFHRCGHENPSAWRARVRGR